MKDCPFNHYECIICKGKKVCCSCDWNNGYHACVKWLRSEGETKNNKTKRPSVDLNNLDHKKEQQE